MFQRLGLLIEGGSGVIVQSTPNGRVFVFAGHLVGRLTAQNELAAAHPSIIAEFLADQWSVRRAADELEGRFILVFIEPDGVCEIAADRFGQADVYLTATSTGTVAASDLSLLPPAIQGGFDQSALAHTIAVYGYRAPKRHTPYSGVTRLGVGQTWRSDHGRFAPVDHPFEPATTGDFGPRELHEYSDLFIDAVRARGSRSGNVVYLSSGWDSTAILATLVHVFGARKSRAVIGRMRYAERSGVINQFELDRAEAVADYFGVRLDVVEFDYRANGPALVERAAPAFRNHHLASITGLNHYTLAEFVAKTTGGDESVFAGEISDGAHNLGFSQFVTMFHQSTEFREYADKMASYLFGPSFLTLLLESKHGADPVYGLFRSRLGAAILDDPAEDPRDRTRQLMSSLLLRAHRFPLWSMRNVPILTEQGIAQYTTDIERPYLQDAASRVTPQTLYAWYLHLYNSFHWQGSTVATINVTADEFGLRMALPFWDSRLQSFLSSMPESWGRGLDLNPTKYPLKWMLSNRVKYPSHLQVGPHSYLYDVDPTFSHSAELLYASSFAPELRARLGSRAYRDYLDPGTFNLSYVDAIIGKYLSNNEARGREMSDLMALSMIALFGPNGH